jgi:hypothetical protein
MKDHNDGNIVSCTLPSGLFQEVELVFDTEHAFLFPSGHVFYITNSAEMDSAQRFIRRLRDLGLVVTSIAELRQERVLLTYRLYRVTDCVTWMVVGPNRCCQ